MFKRFKKLAAVAAVLVGAGVFGARTASAGIAPSGIMLDTLLPGGSNANGVTIGDKLYDNFTMSSTGGMIVDASDVEVLFAVDGDTHHMGFLFDLAASNGSTSDLVISYDVHVLDPARHIKSVGLMFDGGPMGDGDGRSAATVIETVSTLDGSDLAPGGAVRDTEVISVFNDGVNGLNDSLEATMDVNPARALRFTKDILVSSRPGSEGVGISVVENSVTQGGGGPTPVPLPAAFWAAAPVLGALVGGKRLRRLIPAAN